MRIIETSSNTVGKQHAQVIRKNVGIAADFVVGQLPERELTNLRKLVDALYGELVDRVEDGRTAKSPPRKS